MFNVLRESRPSDSERFKESIREMSSGLSEAINQRNNEKKFAQQLQLENDAVKKQFGIDLAGISDPKQRQQILLQELKNVGENKKLTSKNEMRKDLIDQVRNGSSFGNQINSINANEVQNQSSEPIQNINKQKETPEQLFDKAEMYAAAGEHDLSNIAARKATALQKMNESERDYHTKFSLEESKNVNKIRNSLPKTQMALDLARDAIESGEVGAFSLNKLADIFNLDFLRTAKGVQLSTAAKENLLNNLSKVSAKAQNIWLEQRMASIFPRIGLDEEANLTLQEMLQTEKDMDQSYLDEYDRIAEEDMKNYGYEKKDLSKRAHKASEPYQKYLMDKSSYRIKELHEKEQGIDKLKPKIGKNVPKGTPLTLNMARLYIEKYGKEDAIKIAEKNGYKIPTPTEYHSYNMSRNEMRDQ